MKYWRRLCENVTMGFWNAKADLPILEHNLGVIPRKFEDPMQAHAVLWPDMPHDYEFVASIYGKYPKQKHLSKTNMLAYHWGDVIDLVWIWEELKKEFTYEKGCEEKYRQQNLRVIPVVLERERTGIKVNQVRVEGAIPKYENLTQAAQGLAQAYCGFPINLGSTGQLIQYLGSSEGLKLRSMDQDVVAIARNKAYPFDSDLEDKEGFSVPYVVRRVALGAHTLLELRTMYAKNKKIVSDYLEPLRGVGRIYPQINIHTQAGGRHSITKPALATLPPRLRDIIMPDPGQTWIGWDWKAQEPTIMWGHSGSRGLAAAFTQGVDIHTQFVCDLYGWPRPQDPRDPHHSSVDAEWRREHNWGGSEDPRRVFAKQVRYEVAYDHTEKAYNAQQKAIRMGIAPAVAQKAAQVLLNSDPELRDWFRSIMKEGEKTHIVRSWGGSRRVFYWADTFAKIPLNEMRNFPLQAGGADLYNLVIAEIAEAIPVAKFVYGLHDSQFWGVPVAEWESLYPQIKAIAEKPRLIGGRMIPFKGDFKRVDDQGRSHKL
jgi:DNA polymerase I-like protein with 3'-5' exonuclease and polymerase domains